MGTLFRRPTGLVDRRARGRAVRSEHRLGRHRRAVHPQPHLRRRGHLQIDRRRKTWTRMGLEKTGRISRVVIDPKNPDIVSPARSATLRTAAGTRRLPHDRRRQDWERVLFVDENTGCSDLEMDPTNPRKSCSPGCGSSRSRRGDARAADRAAACSRRRRRRDVDAAERQRAADAQKSARSRWRSRRRIRIGSTR